MAGVGRVERLPGGPDFGFPCGWIDPPRRRAWSAAHGHQVSSDPSRRGRGGTGRTIGTTYVRGSERPSGDPLRAHAKAGLTAGTPDFDVVIEQFNRNKRDIAIDLTTDAGHALLERLIVDADVFLTSYLPSTRKKLRIDTTDVFAINPNLVYARGSGQGQRGPDADSGGFDSVSFWSRGGVGHMLSPPGGPLVMQRAAQGDGPSGMFLAGGIAAALFERA